MTNKLLTIKQVRNEKVPACKTKIYSLISEGKFPKPIKVGRSVYWKESDIDEWITNL